MQQQKPKRRTRTTSIMIAVPTTIKAVAEYLGVEPSTVAGRYHRVHDAAPNRVVTLHALAASHKSGPKPFMGTKNRRV